MDLNPGLTLSHSRAAMGALWSSLVAKRHTLASVSRAVATARSSCRRMEVVLLYSP